MISTRHVSEIVLESPADEAMARLEEAAEAQDELAFLAARQAIDWQERPAEDFTHAVRLALMAGAYVAARKLAAEGAERFPEHAELQKMAYILAPPKVTVSSRPPNPGLKANVTWLKTHWDEYRGRWVALLNGQLLGVANTMDELVQHVGEVKNTGILVTKVY